MKATRVDILNILTEKVEYYRFKDEMLGIDIQNVPYVTVRMKIRKNAEVSFEKYKFPKEHWKEIKKDLFFYE